LFYANLTSQNSNLVLKVWLLAQKRWIQTDSSLTFFEFSLSLLLLRISVVTFGLLGLFIGPQIKLD